MGGNRKKPQGLHNLRPRPPSECVLGKGFRWQCFISPYRGDRLVHLGNRRRFSGRDSMRRVASTTKEGHTRHKAQPGQRQGGRKVGLYWIHLWLKLPWRARAELSRLARKPEGCPSMSCAQIPLQGNWEGKRGPRRRQQTSTLYPWPRTRKGGLFLRWTGNM